MILADIEIADIEGSVEMLVGASFNGLFLRNIVFQMLKVVPDIVS